MDISQPEEDPLVKKFLDNIVEDIQIPDVEFSVGKPENGEETEEQKEGGVLDDSHQDNPGNEQETSEMSTIEDEDELPDIPEISGATDRKVKLGRRVSIGNKAVGEMDLYLQGYGEDYGSKSSTTDLEQEGLRFYKEREIKKSLAARDKEKQSRDSSPTKSSGEDTPTAPKTVKEKSRKLISFSKFTRKKKKANKVEVEAHNVPQLQQHDDGDDVTTHHNDITVQLHNSSPAHNDVTTQPHSRITDQPHEGVNATKSEHYVVPQIVIENSHIIGERDSIAVNTSLGGTDSEDTLVDEAADHTIKGHVRLPLEAETVSERVRLLQQSVKEHHPDDIPPVVGKLLYKTYMTL